MARVWLWYDAVGFGMMQYIMVWFDISGYILYSLLHALVWYTMTLVGRVKYGMVLHRCPAAPLLRLELASAGGAFTPLTHTIHTHHPDHTLP